MTAPSYLLFRSPKPARFGRACAMALGLIAATGGVAQTPASDGKTMEAFAPTLNLDAVAKAPPTIEAVVQQS